MESETADNDTKTGDSTTHSQSVDSENEALKPINMKLKGVIKALLQTLVSDDQNLRDGSSLSLSKLSQIHPLSVLSEWLVTFKSEKDQVSKVLGQKKKNSVDADKINSHVNHLIVGLKPIVVELITAESLNGGDVSHRAVLGQILSSLVDEMLVVNNNKVEVVIHDILVQLAKLYMDKVMDVLLLHFQPNGQYWIKCKH